jgi:hypothetical protein
MTEFKAGDKVKINDYYFAKFLDEPDALGKLIKGEAAVVEVRDTLLAVVFDNNVEWAAGHNKWLFAPAEVELVEEAHPLQKEFAKS